MAVHLTTFKGYTKFVFNTCRSRGALQLELKAHKYRCRVTDLLTGVFAADLQANVLPLQLARNTNSIISFLPQTLTFLYKQVKQQQSQVNVNKNRESTDGNHQSLSMKQTRHAEKKLTNKPASTFEDRR